MDEKATREEIIAMAQAAKDASYKMALLDTKTKNAALQKIAKALVDNTEYLVTENKKDLVEAEKQDYSKALIDRLVLNDKRVAAMAQCVKDVIKIKDPVGETLKVIKRPNGMTVKKVRVPIGVIGIIYESRPNVTSDCIALCLKSGNSVILKGGKEAFYSNNAIYEVVKKALKATKIPLGAVQLVASTDREAMHIVMQLDQYVDLIVPRGGESLIRYVAENSRIPVVKHYKGVCHTYVSDKADLKMANAICMNAKVQRPGVCNAMETMLVNKKVAAKFLPVALKNLQNAGVEIRGDERTQAVVKSGVKPATENDWYTEYLDLILSVRVVDNVDQAIEHINKYGSRHSDCIVTKDAKEAAKFLKSVDSASVFHNVSTRFADGYEYGLGAEVGISTDKLHARGPMSLEELTTYKYVVQGKGQVRQ